MKIAIIGMHFGGAGAAYTFEMTRALLDSGCSVLAMITDRSDNWDRWRRLAADNPELSLMKTECYDDTKKRLGMTLGVWRFFAMRRALKRFGAVAIYSPMTHLWHNIVFRWFTPRGVVRIKTIHDVHRHPGMEGGRLDGFFHSFQFRDSERSVILSETFRPMLAEMGVKNIVVIPHPNFDYYGAPRMLPGFKFRGRILFFGNIIAYKGLHVLLEAMEIVVRKLPELKLIVAGSGDTTPYKPAFDRLKANLELHLHRIDDGDVGALFLEADYAVLPYIEASQSGVIPLAYSFGRPVIASAIGGIPEQVEDGVTGFLVPPGDAETLAACIVELSSSPHLVESMGCAAKIYADEKLSWTAAARKLLAACE